MLRWFSGAVAAALLAALLVPLGSSPATASDAPFIFRYRPAAITDPAAEAGARSIPVRVSVDSFTSARWVLSDGEDEVLAAPATLTEDAVVGWRGAFDPTAANEGDPLPNGVYSLQLETTGEDGTALSNKVDIELAFAPAAEAPAAAPVSDVIPSQTWGVGGKASAVQWMAPGLGFGATVPEGQFTVRNAAGKVVTTQTLQPWCPEGRDGAFCLGEENIDTDGTYTWEWDGRVGGTLQPAGRYTLTARIPDRFGRLVDVDLGDFWIRHLETRRAVDVLPAADIRTTNYSVIGRCSSVTAPGPHGWVGSIGLLSKSRCASGLGTADWAFQTLGTNLRADLLDRVVRMRVDGYGAPARAGSRGTIVMAVDLPRSGPVWRRTTVLGAGLGWHIGQLRDVAPTYGIRLHKLVQARVTDGNRYDLKYVRFVYDYRTWVR